MRGAGERLKAAVRVATSCSGRYGQCESDSPIVQCWRHAVLSRVRLHPSRRLQAERAEAASMLERRLAAIEALLTARRQVAAVAVVKVAEPALPDFMKPPPTVRAQSGGLCRVGYRAVAKWVGGRELARPGVMKQPRPAHREEAAVEVGPQRHVCSERGGRMIMPVAAHMRVHSATASARAAPT